MDVREFDRIKETIKKAEIESAKAQGVIDKIKNEWIEKYGTDDLSKMKDKLDELKEELNKLKEAQSVLFDKLIKSCDWYDLERRLNG